MVTNSQRRLFSYYVQHQRSKQMAFLSPRGWGVPAVYLTLLVNTCGAPYVTQLGWDLGLIPVPPSSLPNPVRPWKLKVKSKSRPQSSCHLGSLLPLWHSTLTLGLCSGCNYSSLLLAQRNILAVFRRVAGPRSNPSYLWPWFVACDLHEATEMTAAQNQVAAADGSHLDTI